MIRASRGPYPPATPPLRRRGLRSLAPWLSPWLFIAGVIAGVLLPAHGMRDWLHSLWRGPVQATHDAGEGAAEDQWTRHIDPASVYAVDVLHVIDGDTFVARVRLWPGMEVRTKVRLRGIDAAEMNAACVRERQLAEAASAALRALLQQGQVTIFNVGPDKYSGRVVADSATKTTPNISRALLEAGHARVYTGGRRAGWCG